MKKTKSILEGIGKGIQGTKRLIKNASKNPGHLVRKTAAGVVKDPVSNTIQLASLGVPVPGSRFVMMAAAPMITKGSKKILPQSVQNNLGKTAKEMLSDSRKTRASRIGQKIEIGTNKALMGLSNLSRTLPL